MSTFRIWAEDCDGISDIRYAPTFDNEVDAQAWIDNFTKDMDGSDITDIWVEEETSNYHEVFVPYEGETE